MSGALASGVLDVALDVAGAQAKSIGLQASTELGQELYQLGLVNGAEAAALEQNPYIGLIGFGVGVLAVAALATPIGWAASGLATAATTTGGAAISTFFTEAGFSVLGDALASQVLASTNLMTAVCDATIKLAISEGSSQAFQAYLDNNYPALANLTSGLIGQSSSVYNGTAPIYGPSLPNNLLFWNSSSRPDYTIYNTLLSSALGSIQISQPQPTGPVSAVIVGADGNQITLVYGVASGPSDVLIGGGTIDPGTNAPPDLTEAGDGSTDILLPSSNGGDLIISDNSSGNVSLMVGADDGSTTGQQVLSFSDSEFSGDTLNVTNLTSSTSEFITDIGSGDTFQLDSDAAVSSILKNFDFSGLSGDLQIDNADSFIGTISNFRGIDTIDFAGISATGGTLTSNILAINEPGGGVIDLHMANSAAPQTVYAIDDGNGGTDIVLTEPVPVTTAPTSETVIGGLAASIGVLSVAVPDGPAINETITVVLSDSAGILAASQADGSTLTGAGTTNMTISGSLDAVNTDLSSLTYTGPNTTDNATDIINIKTTNDQGNGDSHEIDITQNGTLTNNGSGGSNLHVVYPGYMVDQNYGGPNGTGPLTQTTVTSAAGNITSQSIGAVYTYTGNELHTNPPASSPVGILTGTATFSVNADTGALDQTSYELNFDAFGTHITNTYYSNIFTFEGSNIVEWFVSELSTDHLSGYLTVYAPSSGNYGQDTADSGLASGGNNDDPGTWAFSGDVATMMISPTAGQTQSLSDAFTNSYLTAEGSIQNVTIAGYGNVVLIGSASISNVLVTGNLVLNNATLNTDPITINSGGTLSANDSTLTGAVTNNGLISADGGLFDMTGDIGGTGTLAIDAGTLFVEGTVAATQILDFGGTAAALLIGTSADVMGSVTGFAPGDMIALADQQIAGFAFDTAASQLTLTSSGGTDVTLALTGTAYNAGDFALVDGELVDEHALCCVEGTHIATPQGERPIEELKIGDLVTTASGEEKPVKWIGKRDYKGAFIADNHLALPITIRKNAIAGNVPADDLEVSPGHGILIAGVLIPAWRLVNGISITQAKAEDIDTVRYLNIELEDHAVIMAQGCPAETFLNIGDFRNQFQNAAEYEKLYPHETARVSNPLPRVEQGALLRDIQNYLNKRAGLPPQAEQKTGTMRGCVDEAGLKTVRGWAQSVENPETPVSLDVLYFIGGTLHKETVVANQYRADLRKEKLGSGCHGFKLELPEDAVNILVRRTINPDQHLSLTMNANQAHETAEARIKNDCPGKPVTSVHRRHVGYPKNRRQLEARRLIA